MNRSLNGGLGYGRQTLIWGNKSAGKSTFALELIAIAQQEGKVCGWIDAENSYDPEWAGRVGVDSSSLILSTVKTTEDATSMGKNFMLAGGEVLVVDSISSLLPGSFFGDKGELKDLGDTKQIGQEARDLGQAVKMWNYVNRHTALILISQLRNKINSYGASHQPTGGESVKFFSSTIIKLTSSPIEANQIKGDVHVGDKIFQKPVGRPVFWQVEFNKTGPPSQSGQYDFYYAGEKIGIDTLGEAVDYAESQGIIIKSGAWYAVYGEKFQGRKATVEWFRDNPDMFEKLKGDLNG